MNKKYYPWIPIIGIPLTLRSKTNDTGLDDIAVLGLSAIVQSISIISIAAIIIFNLTNSA